MGERDGSLPAAQPAMVGGRTMAVLYGSETGNSEEIAVELGKMAERLHFQTTVDEMDAFKLADVLRSSLAIFVTSTTGQGDMPKNTLKFWKNLRREKLNNSNCLRSLRFAIFGLGDSSYLKFNWAARKLRARLLQLGASEFFGPGEGDERHNNGIDSIYLPWYQDLKKTLIADHPLPASLEPIPDEVQLPPKYPIELRPNMDTNGAMRSGINGEAAPLTEEERKFLASRTKSAARSHLVSPTPVEHQVREDWARMDPKFPADMARKDEAWEQTNKPVDVLDNDNILRDQPEQYLLERGSGEPLRATDLPSPDQLPIPGAYPGEVLCNDRVTPVNHWQDVRHLTFRIPLPPKRFEEAIKAGGNLTLVIYPKNYPNDVQELISLMGWTDVADARLDLSIIPRGLYVDKGEATLRKLLTHNLDITAIPKRNFIKELVFFTDDEREKERLIELTAPGNEQEFYDYTSRPRRTILELLRDFTGVKIPFDRVLDLFPVIRGREFSVCNGGVALEDAKAENVIRIEILAALVEYKTIIRKPRQGLCSRYLKHLLPGTKLSLKLVSRGPILVEDAMLAKRPLIAVSTGTGIAPIRALVQERDSYATQGETLIFFGCRNRAADFHFESEWDTYPNVTVYPAFSRDNITPDPATTVSTSTNDAILQASSPTSPPVVMPAIDYDSHKNYVQHLIRKHAAQVGALMRQNPIVCVCGNAGRMPISVRNALLDALVLSQVVPDKEAAEKWFCNTDNLIFWQETW
ncbi:hypothetical protein VTK26DRAFT_5116 [Humicola hyalothermophila]